MNIYKIKVIQKCVYYEEQKKDQNLGSVLDL